MKNTSLLFPKVITAIIMCFCFSKLQAQQLPTVVPPSPEAISMVTYGNTGVNFYTGQPGFSVPIHEISVRGYSFPINLNYSSFQGINVESIAPWVGLGWSLNATGTVSRTVRGLADDDDLYNAGYLVLPNANTNDYADMLDMGKGETDGEPDKFFYNVNGMSGAFFINKSGEVVQKVKTNVKITYTPGAPISSFTITDTRGYEYLFSEQEKSEAMSLGMTAPSNGTPNPITSWYLTSVKDQKGTVLLTFTYHSLPNLSYITYGSGSEKDGLEGFDKSDLRLTNNKGMGKRISEISYSGGKVKFHLSDVFRHDYVNDKWLKSIEILDDNNQRIRQFNLSYAYLDADNGLVPTTVSANTDQLHDLYDAGDFKKRLILTQFQEFNNDLTESLEPYLFEYNTEYNLPSRYSYAKDHWGFYNGKHLNASPEPKQRVKYYTPGISPNPVQTHYATAGTADREPNSLYAKAGVLQKVTYPTGGHTRFEMEGNTAVHDNLPNDLVPAAEKNIQVNDQAISFDVNLINEPFIPLRLTGKVSLGNQSCIINGEIKKSGINVSNFTINPQSGKYSHELDLITDIKESGTYTIKLSFQTGCSYQANDEINLNYDNEVVTANKNVGGLRVKKIIDHDGYDMSNDVVRNYYYNESGVTGNSSGRVVNIPQYSYQSMEPNLVVSGSPNPLAANNLKRTIRPTYPLMSTNGSFVGYGKVTVMTNDGQGLGKTEYEFTTSELFPDFHDGYLSTPLSGDAYFNLGQAGSHETYPFPKTDDRDFMRGLLKKKADFRWNGSGYDTVAVQENEYRITFDLPQDNGETVLTNPVWLNESVNSEYESLEGVVVKISANDEFYPGVNNIRLKKYRIYTGRIDRKKSVTRTFDLGSNSVHTETETTNFWDDLDTNKFFITRSQSKDSEGKVYESKSFFPFHVNSLSGLATNEITTLNDMVNDNVIGPVVQQEQYYDGTKLSTVRTNYDKKEGYYQPVSVETAKGLDNLETRVTFHNYDVHGNLLDVSKDGGARETYIYGYDNRLPTAKVVGAENHSEIAYTSFEQTQKGNWTYSGNTHADVTSPTGRKYYKLSEGNLTKGNLTSTKQYKVTFYAKNGTTNVTGVINNNDASTPNEDGWTYYEKTITGLSTLTISGTADIDEVRIYPINSLMTTYTYDVGYGVLSEGDPNHNIVKYEYDKFGRLQLVKNLDGKVLKAFEYKYKATTSN